MKERLLKLESTIEERKAQKCLRDKMDYDRGQIFTFAKKFDNLRKQKLEGAGKLRHDRHSEQSSVQSSELDTDL